MEWLLTLKALTHLWSITKGTAKAQQHVKLVLKKCVMKRDVSASTTGGSKEQLVKVSGFKNRGEKKKFVRNGCQNLLLLFLLNFPICFNKFIRHILVQLRNFLVFDLECEEAKYCVVSFAIYEASSLGFLYLCEANVSNKNERKKAFSRNGRYLGAFSYSIWHLWGKREGRKSQLCTENEQFCCHKANRSNAATTFQL